MGRKDSAPRRPKQTPQRLEAISRRSTMPQDSRVVSDDTPQTLLTSRQQAKSEDVTNLLSMGATRLVPDHSPQNLLLLSCESLSSSHSDTGPWKRDSIPISLHPFRHSASIDGGALSTARPWPELIPAAEGPRSSSTACWPAATSAACWPAFENNAGFYAALQANGQSLQQTSLNLALSAQVDHLYAALYAPRPPALAPPPATFWNLAEALPLYRAAQCTRPSAADHAMSAAVPRSRFG